MTIVPRLWKVTVFLAILLPSAALTRAQADQGDFGIKPEDYKMAERLLEGNLKGLVKNDRVVPHWLGNEGGFWYRRDTEQGQEYVVVDPAKVQRRPAFDHKALADALADVFKKPVDPGNLGLKSVALNDALTSLKAVVGDKSVTCNLQTMDCKSERLRHPPEGALVSNTGQYFLRSEDNNLVLESAGSGESRPLTDDGEPYRAWGKLPDTSLMTIQIKKHDLALPPWGVQFSPNDRYLVASLTDERAVEVNPYVEWVPTDDTLRPILHEVRQPFSGDVGIPETRLFVFDLQTGARTQIDVPDGYNAGGMEGNVLGWSAGRAQAFILLQTLGSKNLALLRVDLNSGGSKIIIEEQARTRAQSNSAQYNRSNIRIVDDGEDVIWYSDRSGWGHLYLYDAQTGRLKNRITSGDWLVQDIHALDEKQREIYFTGGGREKGRDPYFRHLYRASLDDGNVTLLTPPDADHHFPPDPVLTMTVLYGMRPAAPLIQPDANLFIDTWSRVDEPPVAVLRSSRDGQVIMPLETADASALYATGWQAPVRQAVTAADGETDIYTVYFPPNRELPGGRHPVVDAVYGGPQISVAPRNFSEAYMGTLAIRATHALAALGFAVVTTDGRGTPLRSNAFRDAGYTEFTRVGIEDHVAAIKQLAERHPEIDTDRAGIYGWSWGGTFTAQALMERPDFYHVGVSGAGVYDYAALYPGFEQSVGVPAYADGGTKRSSPDEKPVNWEMLDITAMADSLSGHLLIVYGDMDENVPQSQAFRLVDALIDANKPFDLLYLPNRTHGASQEGYVLRRHFDYFVEHLLGIDPPADVAIDMKSLR
ncbi:S9 family peptidase [Kineobactrum salinum]|uniref:Prolyl oligopeptidase family serine peptidase n=1 Tax=Kineobactrum salinum TaxID=2708301 RepID=A0A6C0U8U5_9GAMM|nr:prolyl oligopeptidase family serine peptidase [Kineobactrum salinum]QIB66985.1 prolyl oligopeptidase family serine peptidase [Kineobactrum salinum]